jgi:predicted nuclease with TOPRIM domain
MSLLERQLAASLDFVEMRKRIEQLNGMLEHVNERLLELHGENAQLRTSILARDLIIDQKNLELEMLRAAALKLADAQHPRILDLD